MKNKVKAKYSKNKPWNGYGPNSFYLQRLLDELPEGISRHEVKKALNRIESFCPGMVMSNGDRVVMDILEGKTIVCID